MSRKEGVMREPLHGERLETSFCAEFDPRDWEGGRYGKILEMARRGACYEEVHDRFREVDEATYGVYEKIVSGTTADMGGNGAQTAMSSGARRRLYMLELSAAGFSAEEIAEKPGASMRTVREALFGAQERTR